jgi:hypothetical protein
MKTIRIPFGGKGRTVQYTSETIDLGHSDISYINVYTVFVDDPDLEQLTGPNFTVLQHPLHIIKPAYDIRNPGNIEEMNLKKTIAEQIMNEPHQ